MKGETRTTEIAIVGAGPAGMAAAIRAAESGAQVTVLDDNPGAGGQIWRGSVTRGVTRSSSRQWFGRWRNSRAILAAGIRVTDIDGVGKTLRAESASDAFEIRYGKLILATGAREFFLPFPGWTLPNVMGAGGLQAMVKSGLNVEGKRIVVTGSGPLLLEVASYLRSRGAMVPLIVEQAAFRRLVPFGLGLIRHPAKLFQAIGLGGKLWGTRYQTGSWIEAAMGEGKLHGIQVRHGNEVWNEPCDYLAAAFGFEPNTELAQAAGCLMEGQTVTIDEYQCTTVADIYCAGEPSGIGGVDLSLVEGEIAGYAAAGKPGVARSLEKKRLKYRKFATALERTFQLRDELNSLAGPQTIVCRCEDVTLGQLQGNPSWRAAKLYTRCGMGPCQGRVCGPAVRYLFGWQAGSIRPPISPTRLENLVTK